MVRHGVHVVDRVCHVAGGFDGEIGFAVGRVDNEVAEQIVPGDGQADAVFRPRDLRPARPGGIAIIQRRAGDHVPRIEAPMPLHGQAGIGQRVRTGMPNRPGAECDRRLRRAWLIGVQTDTNRLVAAVRIDDGYGDVEFVRRQRVAQAGGVLIRPVASPSGDGRVGRRVMVQDQFGGGVRLAGDVPGALPGIAVDGMRMVAEILVQLEGFAAKRKPAPRNAVGEGDERKAR